MRGWLAGILGLVAIGCGGNPAGPALEPMDVGGLDGQQLLTATARPTAGPRHVYVTWTAANASVRRDLDVIAHDALTKIEAAAPGMIVFHRQAQGSPQIEIRIDDSILETQNGARGVGWSTGPCAGVAIIESSATADSLILLHELGHVLISHAHSPYSEDVMAPGGTFRRGPRPATFTPEEAALLSSNLAAGCATVDAWPAR